MEICAPAYNLGKTCVPCDIIKRIKSHIHPPHDMSNTDYVHYLLKKYNKEYEYELFEIDDIKKNLSDIDLESMREIFYRPVDTNTSISSWFSNYDVDNILKQYEQAYPHYRHINFSMINFKQCNRDLNKIKWLYEMKNFNKKYFGCVVNTDKYDGGGKHWFSIFMDFSKEPYSIEYFNSSGKEPYKEIVEWVNSMKEYFKSKNIKLNGWIVTKLQNQDNNFSCGSYSVFYIIKRLQGIPFRYFRKHKIGDDNIIKYRLKCLFSKSNIKV